jgi:hypothetical protein
MTIDTAGRRGLPGLSYPEEHLRRLAHELTERIAGIFNAETIERHVLESYTALLRTSTVHTHLATRTVRFATDRLTTLAQAKEAIEHPVPEVLFVCEQNAGRSQMAAVLAASSAGGGVIEAWRPRVNRVADQTSEVRRSRLRCSTPDTRDRTFSRRSGRRPPRRARS